MLRFRMTDRALADGVAPDDMARHLFGPDAKIVGRHQVHNLMSCEYEVEIAATPDPPTADQICRHGTRKTVDQFFGCRDRWVAFLRSGVLVVLDMKLERDREILSERANLSPSTTLYSLPDGWTPPYRGLAIYSVAPDVPESCIVSSDKIIWDNEPWLVPFECGSSVVTSVPCPDCHGTGEYRGLLNVEPCRTCQGEKK